MNTSLTEIESIPYKPDGTFSKFTQEEYDLVKAKGKLYKSEGNESMKVAVSFQLRRMTMWNNFVNQIERIPNKDIDFKYQPNFKGVVYRNTLVFYPCSGGGRPKYRFIASDETTPLDTEYKTYGYVSEVLKKEFGVKSLIDSNKPINDAINGYMTYGQYKGIKLTQLIKQDFEYCLRLLLAETTRKNNRFFNLLTKNGLIQSFKDYLNIGENFELKEENKTEYTQESKKQENKNMKQQETNQVSELLSELSKDNMENLKNTPTKTRRGSLIDGPLMFDSFTIHAMYIHKYTSKRKTNTVYRILYTSKTNPTYKRLIESINYSNIYKTIKAMKDGTYVEIPPRTEFFEKRKKFLSRNENVKKTIETKHQTSTTLSQTTVCSISVGVKEIKTRIFYSDCVFNNNLQKDSPNQDSSRTPELLPLSGNSTILIQRSENCQKDDISSNPVLVPTEYKKIKPSLINKIKEFLFSKKE